MVANSAGFIQPVTERTRNTANVRSGELVARIGGEEFASVMPEAEASAAFSAAERVRTAFAGEVFPGIGTVTVSAGIRVAEREDTPAAVVHVTFVFGEALLDAPTLSCAGDPLPTATPAGGAP